MKRAKVFIWPLSVLLVASIFFAVEYFFLKNKENSELPLEQQTREVARVKFVYDGDTILIEGNQKVRLLGIDAPEKGEKCYQEAKEYLLNLVLKKEVALQREGQNKDKYGRLLRWVFVDDQNVNLLLLKEGLARVFYGSSWDSIDYLVKLQDEAKREGRGCLWKR